MLRRKLIGVAVSTLVGLVACQDLTEPAVSPVAISNAFVQTLSESACALAQSYAGVSKGFVLSSQDFPLNIPKPRRGNANQKPGRHFVSVELPPTAEGEISVSCIAPIHYTDNLLATEAVALAKSPQWKVIKARLMSAPTATGFAASRHYGKELLTATFASPLSHFSASTLPFGVLDETWVVAKTRKCDDYFDGANPFRAEPASVELGPVIIRGQYYPPYPIDVEEAIRSLNRRGFRSLGDFFPSWFQDGPNCASASEVWLAYQNAAQALENDAAAMDAAANSVQNAVCEQPGTVAPADQTLCFDFYIQSKTAFLIMEGDDRGADPNAPYTASRAQIYVNPNTGVHTLKLNSSTVDFIPGDYPGIPLLNGIQKQPMRHLPKDVSVTFDASTGDMIVKVELYNAFCSIPGRAACPSIDATFAVRNVSGVLVTTSLERDKYPSVQVNQWRNGAWEERWADQEHPGRLGPVFLINVRPLSDKLRREYDMPDGCMLQ